MRAPVVLSKLTGDCLRDALKRMSNVAAGGADGWIIAEMKTWPDLLFEKLADFLNDVESSSGNWPHELLLQIVSLIPKDDSGDDQRPISVSCLVYRVWASARARDLCIWQDAWAHESQWGYRRGKRSVDPSWISSAAAEHAWLSHAHRVGFSLDLAKAFDRVPHQILHRLLTASGLPANFCDAWLSAIRGAKKFLKSAYGLGRPFHVNRGLPQGDALACFGMNLIMSVWSRAVAAESSVSVRSFADDATVETEDRNLQTSIVQLQTAISVTEEFTTLSGQLPNVTKCFTWSTSKRGRKALASVRMFGNALKQKHHAKDLGCQAVYSGPARNSVLQARFRKARKAALRVRCAPLNLEDKSQLVTGAASSLAIYGLETCPIGDGAFRSLRSAVATAIWGLQRRFRSVHAVLLLFSQSHLTDPFQAQVCQSFLTLQRCLRSDPVVANSWETWWHTASLRAARARGPVTLLWSLLSRINWSWITPWTLRTHDNVDISILDIDTNDFGHRLRDACRIWCWQQAFVLHKHFDGVQFTGVDRSATLHLSTRGKLLPHCLRLLRSILVDAVWTQSRLYHAHRVDSPQCSCGHEHQDTEHFFWSCVELAELKTKHAALFALRDSSPAWPLCLTLCGLLPSNFHSPQCSNIRVAVLVQSYLLDVLRRSWKDGWPMDQTPAGKPSSSRPSPSAVLEFVDLKLPTCLPQLSSTTFSWPLDFCRDLLDYLKALRWPKKPTAEGVSWAELTVNFEIVTGKAVPTSNGAKTRTYGQAAVPLLESPDNLYTKVLTMSNACRCLARLLGKPVVVGRQTRVQIAGLPGNHQFNGLDRKPLMSLESQTRQTLHDCLHKRLFAEIDSVSAKISACETPAQNPVKLAALGLNLLKWDVSKKQGTC